MTLSLSEDGNPRAAKIPSLFIGDFSVVLEFGLPISLERIQRRVRLLRVEVKSVGEVSVNGVFSFLTKFAESLFQPFPIIRTDRLARARSGELIGYYWDWEILYSTEEIFDCRSSGIAHKHVVNRMIARRHPNEREE